MMGKKLERIEKIGAIFFLGERGRSVHQRAPNTLLVSVVGKCGRNADQHNSEYGLYLRSGNVKLSGRSASFLPSHILNTV